MSSSTKRSAEWIDLTQSSPPPPAKQARVHPPITPPVSSQLAPSQYFNARDSWGAEYEENEIIDLSQDAEEGFGWVCVGAIEAKIVGIRYYNGYATPGEQVMIKREPSNQYDTNAIRVNNVQGTQIGHLPRQLASKLAPFMVSEIHVGLFDMG